MTEYLELNATDCKHCYKCIRDCPVKAIRFSGHQATIVQEECILCGRCFVSCPQNAKRVHNDLPKVQALVKSGAPVYASVAPSFVANYMDADIDSMNEALRQLGFAAAEETALAATLVKQQYDRLVCQGEQRVIISTCCHTLNMLVERYYPELLPSMAAVVSPMQAHAMDIRRRCPDARVVFIGPCISKKAEAERYPDDVNGVLTFEELDVWLAQKKIKIGKAHIQRHMHQGKTRLFPTAGGILRTMEKSNSQYDYIAIDGIDHCIAVLADIAAGGIHNCFVEMSACSGSCIGGPSMSHNRGLLRSTTCVNAYAKDEDFPIQALPSTEMTKKFRFNAPNHPKFGEKAISEVLRKIGKTKPEDELNCGSCGYDTCREKAQAVLEGKASLEMCLPFLMNKAQSFSDTIIKNTLNGIVVLNEALEVQQINDAARRMMNIKHEADVLQRNVVCLMDPLPFLEVLEEGLPVHEQQQYLADYGKHIMLTIIWDKECSLLIGIMRDVTEAEATHEKRQKMANQTIAVTDEVIDRQMRTAQEIASLLGETVAETKTALTKLKETLRHE